MSDAAPRYLALCGGVGGAKLALGLAKTLTPEELVIVVNNGDDFEHLGLTICPDLDTVTYTLGNAVHPGQGWGRDAETWSVLDEVARLGGESWFRLGDRDLALHLTRKALLDACQPLSEVTRRLTRRFGIAHTIAPMSDDPVRTMVCTAAGLLPFQHYFVREKCAPAVKGIQYQGAAAAIPSSVLSATLADPRLAGVIVCPSNPYLSIDPILSLPGVRDALQRTAAPVIAVAPIVGGEAIKGPTAKIMRELGLPPTAAAVAAHYADILDGYLVDSRDASLSMPLGSDIELLACNIVMKTLDDKTELARRCVEFIRQLAASR